MADGVFKHGTWVKFLKKKEKEKRRRKKSGIWGRVFTRQGFVEHGFMEAIRTNKSSRQADHYIEGRRAPWR